MKTHCPKMLIAPLLVAWGIVSVLLPIAAYAADSQDRTDFILKDISGYLSSTDQENISVSDAARIPAAPALISWNATIDDLFVKGGVIYQFAAHMLNIKLGFIRGAFDSYTQTYKAEPVVFLHDATDRLTYPYLQAGPEKNYKGGTLDIWMKFNGKNVEIYTASERIKILYPDLLKSWDLNAASNCLKYLEKKYCIIPQNLWNGIDRYGFVITENTPLYYTTNLPQDFVELYKEESGSISYKPIAYSLASRLAFVLSPDQKNIWEIRPMTPEEVGGAMLERSRDRATSFDSMLPIVAKAKCQDRL